MQELKRRPLMEMPYLIGIDDMSSAYLVTLQKVIDGGDCRAGAPIGTDGLSRAMDLPKPTAFGMRL
jgi:hypothetical protein